MAITVELVLTLNGFREAQVVGGQSGLINRVSNASLMEVPDIFNYVDANNLLITTLYPIYDDEEAMVSLIPRLAAKNLAGICIKPMRYVKEIPSIMIQQADHLGFPLIQLPPDANLSTLVNQILELSLNTHINILKFRNLVHEKLMDLFLRGAEIHTLIDTLADMVTLPVLLLDRSLEVVCVSKDLAGQSLEISEETNEGEGTGAFAIIWADQSYTDGSYIKYAIKAGKTGFGYIVLLKGEKEDPNLMVAVEQAALLIASVFYKNNAVLEKEKNFQDAFIRDILQGKIQSQMETINKAKAFGWKLEFPQIIAVIKVIDRDELKKKQLYEYLIGAGRIEDTFAASLSISPNQIKTIYLDDSLVVFVNVLFVSRIKEYSIEIGKGIIGDLKNRASVGMGISGMIESIERFPGAYREAHEALNLGAVMNQGSFVSHYEDYRLFHLIKEISQPALLADYVEQHLGKLLAYDRDNQAELLNTLKVVMEENFNLKRAAQRLFIHYNTLRYRVEKIRELGIGLDNGFQIGELALAYYIYLWNQAQEE